MFDEGCKDLVGNLQGVYEGFGGLGFLEHEGLLWWIF